MFTQSLILLPLLAVLVFLVPMKWKWPLTLGIVTLGVVCSLGEALSVLIQGAVHVYRGVSNVLFGDQYEVVDILSAVFLLILSLAAFSVTFYARGYVEPKAKQKPPVQISLHYFCLMIMYFSMLIVVTARDGFLFLFAWELMTLASFLLVLFDGDKPKVRRAALNYLILMHVGFMFLLAGFVTLYVNGLPVSFDSLAAYFGRGEVVPLFVVFLIGFGMKAGIFPLHIWLPEAHPAAPPHVSALMSGVMVKMGVYGIMRVCSYIQTDLYTVGLIVLMVGVVTGLWGVILATLQNDIKKILAYSTIENVGIILLALGMALLAKSQNDPFLAVLAYSGAVLHVVNHSFFKSLLYMGAGNVSAATHTTSLDDLGGLGRRMPVTAGLFLLGSVAICALPPLNGFVSEFLIYNSLFEGIASNGPLSVESLFALIFLAFIGGLVVMAFVKLYGVAFQGHPRSVAAGEAREVGHWMIVAMAMPLAGIWVVGLLPTLFLPGIFEASSQMLGVNGSGLYAVFGDTYRQLSVALWVLVGILSLLWGIRWWTLRRRHEAGSPTWVCGFTAPTPKLQYTGESFSESLERISERVMKKSGHEVDLASGEIFPVDHRFEVTRKDKIDQLFSRWWLIVLRRINAGTALLRTGKVNHYVLFAMLFLLLVFLLSLFNWLK